MLFPLSNMQFSAEGARLLSEMESPTAERYLRRDSAGNVTHIKNHDVGETVGGGGITIGFGTFVRRTDIERQQWLLREFGIDATSVDIWVPIDVALRLYAHEQLVFADRARGAIRGQGIEYVSQQQFDAIVIQVFNRNSPAIIRAYFNESLSDEQVIQEILDDYRRLADWDQYARGWENRIRATVRVFRHGIYLRDY